MKITRIVLAALFLVSCGNSTPGPCTADTQCTTGRCCAGKCVDVQTSAANCGACFAACSTQNASSRCTAGVCSITCTSGFGDCNQAIKDGCETELTSAVNHCGMCGNACMASNATTVCERSQCLQSSCNSGYGDCNASSTDGCEIDLKSSNAHCGGCGKKCEVVEGVGLCTQSTCTVAACNSGFGDCDLSAPTGCETNLTNTLEHCGMCGMACLPGYKCKASKCVAPELLFYGGILSITSQLATDVVSAFNVDTHGWSAIATSGTDTPGNRFSHAAVWDSAGNRMLVWGGYLSGNLPADNALYALDFSGGEDGGAGATWKKLTTTGGPPSNRGMMGWAWNKATRTLFIQGGTDANNNFVYDELWQLDVATLTWTQRTEAGSPGGRFQHIAVWDSASQRLLVGQGYDDNFFALGDFFAFDPAADGGGWSPVVAANEPTERTSAVFLGAAQPLHLYGGIDDFGDLSDELFRLDAVDAGLQWIRLVLPNAPSTRGYPTGAGTVDRRFLFGGFNFSGQSQNDVWELSDDAGWMQIADAGVNFVHPGAIFTTAVARE